MAPYELLMMSSSVVLRIEKETAVRKEDTRSKISRCVFFITTE